VILAPRPADNPVTKPDEDTPTAGLLLVHDPPTDASLSDMDDPWHTLPSPTIGNGNGLIVTGKVAGLHACVLYEITAIPTVAPVTTPVDAPTVAEPVPGVLVQVPPGTVLVNAMALPIHTLPGPVIADGGVVTVMFVLV